MKNLCLRTVLLCVLSLVGLTVSSKEKVESPEFKLEANVQSSGYVGEVLTYEVSLLSSSPEIANVRVKSGPSFAPGIKAISGVVRNQRPEKVIKKGKTYFKWAILRYFLIASEPGKKKIPEVEFVVFIPHERIVYQGFWGNQRIVEYEEVSLKCNSVDFKIKQLPKNTTGSEFAESIGNFKVEAWFPPGNIIPGTEAYAVFCISGYGNLSDLKIPNLYKLFNIGCRLREIEQTEERTQKEGRLFSEVYLTCRFVPETENFEIHPLTLLFFNPQNAKYYQATSDALHWTGHPSGKRKAPEGEAIPI